MKGVFAGFALGLAGSAHCVAMCGPIVALVRHQTLRVRFSKRPVDRSFQVRWLAAWLYQGTRVLTYALLGLVVGSARHLAGLWGLESVVLFILGGLLIATAVGLVGSWPHDVQRAAARVVGPPLRWAVGHADRSPRLSATVAGGLNALLPCGMVYTALAAAMMSGEAIGASAFMLGFGAGTVPLMSVAWLAISRSRPLLRRAGDSRLLAAAAMLLVGVLLISRGFTPAGAASTAAGSTAHSGHSH